VKYIAAKINAKVPNRTLHNIAGAADDFPSGPRLSAGQGATKLSKAFSATLDIMGHALAVAGLAYDLYIIWSTFSNFGSPYGYEQTGALVFAIASTALVVTLFVLSILSLSLSFVLLIFSIISLITTLIALAYGEDFDLMNFLITGLIGLW